MTTYVSKRLQTQVLDLLRLTDEPMSTQDVALVLGKSQQAVRIALNECGAWRVDESHPVLWTVPDTMKKATRRAPSKYAEIDLTVSTASVDNIVDTWNASVDTLSKAISELRIDPKSNPKKEAERIGTVAGSMAYLAYELNEVAGKPDWYEILTEG